MIYKAYLKQCDEGCDYTIGCAQTVINIIANDIDQAKLILFNEISENYRGERKLILCELYEINEVVNCDLDDWYNKMSNIDNLIKQQEIEDIERIEYERLRKKFEIK